MPPKRPPLTHFLCIPLITSTSRPQFQTSLSTFTASVTAPNPSPSPSPNDTKQPTPLSPKAIRPVGAIHFTLGVMSLQTPERVEAACSFLRGLDIVELLRQAEAGVAADPNSTRPAMGVQDDGPNSTTEPAPPTKEPPLPLHITLTGLHPMQPPTKTSSLYTHPTPPSTSHLTPFCHHLLTHFRANTDFLLPDSRPFTLHATIVNTIYAREARSGKKRWSKDSGKIDATDLIERWRDYVWVRDMRIERVSICEMGAKKVVVGEEVVDQVYTEVASVALP